MNPDQLSLVKDLLDLEEGLTAWEIEFLDSLFVRSDVPLTWKQEQVIDHIARKVGLIA